MRKLGVSATQYGMTNPQRQQWIKWVMENGPWSAFHHGDCIGGDEEAFWMIREVFPNLRTVAWPGDNSSKRAYTPSDLVMAVQPNLQRNRCIAEIADVLVAAPNTPYEVIRSGTWTTIRYARKLGKHVEIIGP